jgi:nicotinate-nucleotide pyrophosphorylase (carboxylating)
MAQTRQERLKTALFRGESLNLQNLAYSRMLRILTEELLRGDKEPRSPTEWPTDLTVEALGTGKGETDAVFIANEPGILAGMEEAVWFFTDSGARATSQAADGQTLESGQPFLKLEGDSGVLLSLERVGLNLLQRMSGIATAAQRLQDRVHRRAPQTNVVATRKTPWGLLDKRAAHLGGAGTHRLGLGDAILIKGNHLRLFAAEEEDAIPLALRKAWASRPRAVFIEIEVTGLAGALAAGRTFRELRRGDEDSYPCLVMLDNRSPEESARIIAALIEEGVWDDVLVEVSGGVNDATLDAYADCGADAISIGALTHSCKALDLSCKLGCKLEAEIEKHAGNQA